MGNSHTPCPTCPPCPTSPPCPNLPLSPSVTLIDGCLGAKGTKCLPIANQCGSYGGVPLTQTTCFIPGAYTILRVNPGVVSIKDGAGPPDILTALDCAGRGGKVFGTDVINGSHPLDSYLCALPHIPYQTVKDMPSGNPQAMKLWEGYDIY